MDERYLTSFEDQTSALGYTSGDTTLVSPQVSLVGVDEVVYSKEIPNESKIRFAKDETTGKLYFVVDMANYLCLEPIDSNNQLALAKIGDYSNIQYSFDKSNWNDFAIDPTNPMNLTYISVDKPIYLRGNNPNGILNQELLVGCKLVSSGKYNVYGDVTTLLNEEGNVKDLTPYGESSLAILFSSLPSETTGLPIDLPGVDVVDASKLILPSTVLTDYCYQYMFDDCTSLVAAPKLPAATLANSCYDHMFSNCTSLTTSPSLPATVLSTNCYNNMFINCTSLVAAPELPATELANSCYNGMFKYCTSLVTAPELPATTLVDYCYMNMFNGCTSLTTVPSLPATELANSCYYEMFENCTSLTVAPELPATTLSDNCYYKMFYSCDSLTTVPSLPATELANSCYYEMFMSCNSLTAVPVLPATVLSESCYESMFAYCYSLTTAPELPATTLADSCYTSMFQRCDSLTTAPAILPATVLSDNCYNHMFFGCGFLTTAPELPATVLTNYCYQYMFYGCRLLNYIKCLAIDISSADCTNDWVYEVSGSGTFVKHPDVTSWTSGVDGIPSGWVVENYAE